MTSLPITYAEDEPAMTNDPDSVHPSAADSEGVSGSDVPARPTSLSEVRMLTWEELEQCRGNHELNMHVIWAVQHKFCEINGLHLPSVEDNVHCLCSCCVEASAMRAHADDHDLRNACTCSAHPTNAQCDCAFCLSMLRGFTVPAPPVADPRQADKGVTK